MLADISAPRGQQIIPTMDASSSDVRGRCALVCHGTGVWLGSDRKLVRWFITHRVHVWYIYLHLVDFYEL